jgi:2-polyprenyl-3-methyl-5-hydroxy-6-metoxy-1,4-benzoquinol methylase
MTKDHSAGWETVSGRFMAIRSDVGAALVRSWARSCLPPSATILDVGCGSGVPIARSLVRDGFSVWGVDASPSLISAYRTNVPDMPTVCGPAQDSDFFGRSFDGVIAIGLVFLLGENDQRKLFGKVATALEPGGRFLFSAPREACRWNDTLTGRVSVSLGQGAYSALLVSVGFRLNDCQSDEGGNNYYEAVKAI